MIDQASAEFGQTNGFAQKQDDQLNIQRDGLGHKSSVGGPSKISANENFMNNEDAAFGRGSQYNAARDGPQQNFSPSRNQFQDESGRSESSEGIIDHNPFNKQVDVIKDDVKQGIKQIMGQAAKPGKKKTTVLYSDRSDSSYEENMGDTPSNYNMANGRLDGKSLGLKAILLQAQKHSGVTIENKAGGMPSLQQHDSQLVGRMAAGIGGGLDRSADGGWNSLN